MRIPYKTIGLALVLALAGCKTVPDPPCDCKPIIINGEIPAPAVVVRPVDPVAELKRGDPDDTVAKAYVIGYQLMKRWAESLDEALQPYRDASVKTTTTTTTTTSTATSTTEPTP